MSGAYVCDICGGPNDQPASYCVGCQNEMIPSLHAPVVLELSADRYESVPAQPEDAA